MKYLRFLFILLIPLTIQNKLFSMQISSEGATILKKERKITIHTETAVFFIKTKDTKSINVLTSEGVKKYANIKVPYKKGTTIRNIEGKVIKPDGTIIPLSPENIEEKMIFPQYFKRNYIKENIIHFPGVEPGCILEYTVERISESLYFIDPFYFQDELYVNEAELIFDLKMGFEYAFFPLNQGSRDFTAEKAKWELKAALKDLTVDAERYKWKFNNIEPLEAEINMPPKRELSFGCLLTLTYYKFDPYDYAINEKWKNVSDNMKKLYNYQLKKNDKVKKTAKEITRGIKDKEEKVRAIFSYIESNIKLLPVIGIRPSPLYVNDILETKLGDNQEINLLFVSMLKEAGIKAYPCLISTRDYGLIYPQFPSPDQFNRVITFIPDIKDGLWLDPSEKFSRYPFLPYNCQDVFALPIGYKNGKFLKTPLTGMRQNLINHSAEITVTDDGFVKGKVKSVFYAQNELKFRKLISKTNIDERKNYYEKLLQTVIPEASITDFDITSPEDLSKSMEINYSFETKKSLLNDENNVEINPAVFVYNFHNYFSDKKRTYPFFLDFKKTEMVLINIKIPANTEIVSIPKSTVNRQYFGEFFRVINRTSAGLSYQEKLILKQDKFEVEEYKLLENFSNQILNTKKDKIIIKIKK